jgi:8-oxo-dGTP pyrophosphatase MutT (NUDIX family)
MRFDEIVSRLAPESFLTLPGAPAQALLAPRPRRGFSAGAAAGSARAAAGLALLYPAGDDTLLLLTVRGSHLARHRGQVSLPGGAIEEGETIEQAALREAAEEVGLDPEPVRVHGRLTPLPIPVSGYLLHPVVATVAPRPHVVPSQREVERLVEVPIAALVAPGALRVETRMYNGVPIEVPYYDLGGAELWGATGMVVAELLALLGLLPVPRSAL